MPTLPCRIGRQLQRERGDASHPPSAADVLEERMMGIKLLRAGKVHQRGGRSWETLKLVPHELDVIDLAMYVLRLRCRPAVT